jgi:hypothetical protein
MIFLRHTRKHQSRRYTYRAYSVLHVSTKSTNIALVCFPQGFSRASTPHSGSCTRHGIRGQMEETRKPQPQHCYATLAKLPWLWKSVRGTRKPRACSVTQPPGNWGCSVLGRVGLRWTQIMGGDLGSGHCVLPLCRGCGGLVSLATSLIEKRTSWSVEWWTNVQIWEAFARVSANSCNWAIERSASGVSSRAPSADIYLVNTGSLFTERALGWINLGFLFDGHYKIEHVLYLCLIVVSSRQNHQYWPSVKPQQIYPHGVDEGATLLSAG